MSLKGKIQYPSLICFLLGGTSLLFALTEYGRVRPELLPYFFGLKSAAAIISFALGIQFMRRAPTDFGFAAIMIVAVFYSVSNIWFLPLYEFAFFECAIATAFLHPRRRWIFPICYSVGVVGILASYEMQDHLNWQKPQAVRADWVWSIILVFIVAWFIHQFVLRQLRHETEKRRRYSLLGRESTRLIHDIKGLLGSPLMLLESLQSAKNRGDTDYVLRTTDLLQHDLLQVREVLAQLNRLVIINNDLVPTEITGLLQEAASVLRFRLNGVRIEYPEPRTLAVAPERLHSVFFNLFLNAVEAFQQNQIAKPVIRIRWEADVLKFTDNAGGIKLRPGQASTKKTGSGGLGLEIIESELQSMNISFELTDADEGACASLKF